MSHSLADGLRWRQVWMGRCSHTSELAARIETLFSVVAQLELGKRLSVAFWKMQCCFGAVRLASWHAGAR